MLTPWNRSLRGWGLDSPYLNSHYDNEFEVKQGKRSTYLSEKMKLPAKIPGNGSWISFLLMSSIAFSPYSPILLISVVVFVWWAWGRDLSDWEWGNEREWENDWEWEIWIWLLEIRPPLIKVMVRLYND